MRLRFRHDDRKDETGFGFHTAELLPGTHASCLIEIAILCGAGDASALLDA